MALSIREQRKVCKKLILQILLRRSRPNARLVYTLHAIAVMAFDSVAFKNVVSNGLVQDKSGQKMSKSKGNAVEPFETIATYGADATRWYMISNAQPWTI